MFLVPVERRATLSLFGSIDGGATVAAEPLGKLAASLMLFLRETLEPGFKVRGMFTHMPMSTRRSRYKFFENYFRLQNIF
jgi:hypothetical protein